MACYLYLEYKAILLKGGRISFLFLLWFHRWSNKKYFLSQIFGVHSVCEKWLSYMNVVTVIIVTVMMMMMVINKLRKAEHHWRSPIFSYIFGRNFLLQCIFPRRNIVLRDYNRQFEFSRTRRFLSLFQKFETNVLMFSSGTGKHH